MVQVIKQWTFDVGSGHDFRVARPDPCVGLQAGCAACLSFSLPLSLLQLSILKNEKEKKKKLRSGQENQDYEKGSYTGA